MAATFVGIVLSIRQNAIRRVIVPDFDAQLDDPSFVGTGERLIKIAMTTYRSWGSPADMKAYIEGQEGASSLDRLCILDGLDRLVAIVRGDYEIDGPNILSQLPNGYSLIESDLGEIGETWPFKQVTIAGGAASVNVISGPT